MPSAFPIARPVAFPLLPIVDGKCACGNADCSRIGKHPAVSWGELSYGDLVPRPEPGAGVGLKTGAHPKGSDCIVVDLDSEDACALFETLGPCPDTFIVETPRGWHFYFEHPGFPVKNSAGDLGKGIDIRGDGGFVVAPGSPHRSGGAYGVWANMPIAPAPAWLLEWLKRQPGPAEISHYPGDIEPGTPEHARRRELYAAYLRADAVARGPERRGQGDAILFNVVQRGAYDLALPVDDVLELVREHYDPRCSPMWGDELEERVHHKARCAKEESHRPRMEPLPADLAHLASNAPPEFPVAPPTQAAASELGERWGGWDIPMLPPVYLLEGLIPAGKVVTFFAEGGSVKTWSALALAIAVATGAPWLGHYSVKKGRVLYLDYEDGPYEVQRRVRILTGGADVPDLGYLYAGPQIDGVELWKTLARKVIDEGISLIVIDSLGAGMPGDADENTTAFANGMKIAGRFTETGCTVLFVHHANKTGGMRGTSAARDQSDVVFKFESVSETDAVKRMRMVCDKPGPQKRPAPVNVELSDAGLKTFVDEAQTVGRNAKTPADIQAAIKLALASGPIATIEKLRHAVGGKAANVHAEVRELEAKGQVKKIPDLGYVLDDDAARTERVLAQVRSYDGWASEAQLATAAHVPTQYVKALTRPKMADGVLVRGSVIVRRATGDELGGFIEVE